MEHRWCVVDVLNWRLKQELMLRVITRIFVKQFVNKTVIKMYLTEKKTIFVYTQRSSSFVQCFWGGGHHANSIHKGLGIEPSNC